MRVGRGSGVGLPLRREMSWDSAVVPLLCAIIGALWRRLSTKTGSAAVPGKARRAPRRSGCPCKGGDGTNAARPGVFDWCSGMSCDTELGLKHQLAFSLEEFRWKRLDEVFIRTNLDGAPQRGLPYGP